MILLALINFATATETVNSTQLDSLIQAKPAVEMSVAGPAEATVEVAKAPTEAAPAVDAESAPTVDAPVEATTAVDAPVEATTAVEASTESITPINWDENGSNAVKPDESATNTRANMGVSLVMIPVSLGLMGLVFFFRKRVFNQTQSPTQSDPMTVVARKATGNQSAIFLVDVADLEGGTRRLLIGSSPNGNSLLADVSPTNALFPEPMFEQSPMAAPTEHQAPPALRAVQNDEPQRESARELLDFGPKRALIDELISSSEKSSFRPRSMKKAYADTPTVSTDSNPEEKRRAAQAVLDEVLAERRAGHQGTQVRVTA
jgi:flagellar biogenesis protein FliO